MRENGDQAGREWLMPCGVSFCLWVFVVLLLTLSLALASSIPLAGAFKAALSLLSTWALAAPFTVFMAYLFPLSRSRLARNLALHLVACGLIIAVNIVAGRALGTQVGRAIYAPPVWRAAAASDEGGGLGRRGAPPQARAAADLLIYFAVASICHATRAARVGRERERRALAAEAQLGKARLAVLQMQINPHFLFNTLNTIAALVHSNPQAADNMICDLSELLRGALESASEQEVSLRRELTLLQPYMDIQRTRLGDRLEFRLEIAASELDALVPTFMLQPLLENAVRHGIESGSLPGCITLAAARHGDRLRLTVSDTGIGAKDDTRPGGIGLANTRERLKQLYGTRSSIALSNGDHGGCVVTIELPFCRAPLSGKEDKA